MKIDLYLEKLPIMHMKLIMFWLFMYTDLSNNHGGWNKGGGGKKVAKSINVEGGIF